MDPASRLAPGFSWRVELINLFRFQRAPAAWLLSAGAVVLITLAIDAICLAVGILRHNDADKLFGEKTFGTYASVGLLISSGVVCFLTSRKVKGMPLEKFWFWWGVLLCFVTLDDLVKIHEQVDIAIHFILGRDKNDPVTDHLDDLLLFAYTVPAAWLGLKNRQSVFKIRLMLQTLMIAFAFFVGMVACDFLGAPQSLEESFKLVADGFILCAFLAPYLDPDLSRTGGGMIAPSPASGA